MQLSELDWAYVQERAAYFTGRDWVFARLERFFYGPPGVFLLLGEPGTGKTAIAAKLALAAVGRLTPAGEEAEHRVVPLAAAYFCRAGQVDLLDVAQRLSDQLAEAVPGFAHARQATLLPDVHVGDVQVHTGDVVSGSVTGVHIDLSRLEAETAFVRAVTLPLKRVREAGGMTQIVLLVDALDEGLASQTAEVLPQLLGRVEYAHLLVTTRPDHRATGWLRGRAESVDLLADAPPDSDDVLEYLQRRLTSEGAPEAMAVLSQRIAEQASGNFLYAFYVAEEFRHVNVLAGLDAAAARAVPLPEGGLPGVYRDFLRRELWHDGRAWSRRYGPVLAPLAVAQDEGLTTEQLRLMAGRLSDKPMSRTLVRDVTRTARQFLDGPVPDGPFHMYHQSFANFLLDPGQNPDFLIDTGEAHNAIVEAYASTNPLNWDDYARRNLALHAAQVGRLDHLLEDVRFLLVAEPSRLTPHLDSAQSAPASAAATVYRETAHDLAARDWSARASQLELTARRMGYRSLAARIGEVAPDRPWQSRWSHGRQITGHQVLTGHVGRVWAVAIGALLDGTPVIVSSGRDGTVRVWRLADGTRVGEPITGHSGDVGAVAIGALLDGTPVIVSGGRDGTVRVWRLADGTPVGEPITGHSSGVLAIAVGEMTDGTRVIVSGDVDGTVRVWRLADGTPVGKPITAHSHAVGAVAVTSLPDGTPVIVSHAGGLFATVRVWRLADGTPVGVPLDVLSAGTGVGGVGTLQDGTPVVASSRDNGVGVWRLTDWDLVVKRPSGRAGVWAVAVGTLPGGAPIVASGDSEGTVWVWQLADSAPVWEPLTGHASGVWAVAVGSLPNGTPVIASGDGDGSVRVWRLSTATSEPLRGPTRKVRAVTAGTLSDDTPVIISLSGHFMERAVRMSETEHVQLTYPEGGMSSLALGALPDGTLVLAGGGGYGFDGLVQVWRLADGSPVSKPLIGRTSKAKAIFVDRSLPDGTEITVSGNGAGIVRVWRLTDWILIGEPLTGHAGGVSAVAVGSLPDGTPVIVSGDGAGTVRVSRLADGAPLGKPLTGHAGGVSAVAVGSLPDGTPVIVSGDGAGTVRVSRLADGAPLGKPLTGHAGGVSAVAVGSLPDGTPVIVSGDGAGTVRVSRLVDGAPLRPAVKLPEWVYDVAVHGNVIITATGADIAVHSPAHLQLVR